MQAGLADIRAWVAYMGPQWCGEATDVDQALEHSSQAARYMLTGKDDCVRRASKVRTRHMHVLLADHLHTRGAHPRL